MQVEIIHTRRPVNGKPLSDPSFHSFGGQASTFIWHYLDAPVSAKEVSEDAGQVELVRIVALYYRSSTLYRNRYHIRCLYF